MAVFVYSYSKGCVFSGFIERVENEEDVAVENSTES